MSTTAVALDATDAVTRPTRTAGVSLLAAGPACIVCGVPFLWPALAAMGLGATPFIAHSVSWLLVPLVVVLLARNVRRHGDRRPLRLAMAGAAVYAVHVVTHVVGALGEVAFLVTDHVAVALLGAAALWDLAVTRRVRRRVSRVRQDDHRARGTRTVNDTTMRPDFVDVYDEHLGPLWRFVRSRVPDPYAAEDLTAEVFSRAWKGWGRFDPGRGNAAAWLFGIAHNVVADWWRHRPAEVAMEEPHEPDPRRVRDVGAAPADPADQPLRREATERVAAAVGGLSQRDRDALALRYGGGLAVADVAAVLEVSLSAAKMTISRALERLRAVVAVDDADVDAHDLAPTLSSLLDDTRSRLVAGDGDPALLELVAHLAVVHDHEVPEELPGRIAACIGCREYEHLLRDGDRGPGRRRERPAVLASIWLLLGVTCLVCTLPVLWPLLGAVGLSVATSVGHDLGLLVAPVVYWVVRRQSRRHGDRLPQWLAGVGMSLLLVHAALHFSPGIPLSEDGGTLYVSAVWTFADWAGSGLLLAGVLAHWRSLESWLRAQRAALVERVVAERRPSAPLRAQGP